MKKPIIALVCALSLGLSGCGTVKTVAETVGISESKVAEVQRLTESICSFVVAADSVSALLGTAAYTAISLAQGICSGRDRQPASGPSWCWPCACSERRADHRLLQVIRVLAAGAFGLLLAACGSSLSTMGGPPPVYVPQETQYPAHYTVKDCKRLRRWTERHSCRVYFGKWW